MKIGVNIKKIQKMVAGFVQAFYQAIILPDMQTINNKCEWLEITSSNGQEAEITQEFTEIKMQARGTGTLYSVTCDYDSNIFHNNSSNAPTYIVTGNPIENNYGCKFKYMKQPISEKQYVCVDKCFSGGSQEGIEFRAWIKPKNSSQ